MPEKYQRWYNQIIDRGRNREIPRCYTEMHHIKPRSHGGPDEDWNLVRLTYREHFLVHWLLIKICAGAELRSMQRAFFAMTLKCSPHRLVAGWQFEAAKRAVRDLELDPVAEQAWQDAYRRQRAARKKEIDHFSRQGRIIERQENADLVARVAAAGKLNKTNVNDAAKLLLRLNKPVKRHQFRNQGLSQSEVEHRVTRRWRALKNTSTVKRAKSNLEAALGVSNSDRRQATPLQARA